MQITDLSRDDLVGLAQQTYEKDDWTQDDLMILRGCWDEFENRGGENAVMFFRPAFFGVLKFHEIETGEVDEEFIRTLEPSEIAREYREIVRKLERAVPKGERNERRLKQEIARWCGIQQRLSHVGAYYAATGAPLLPDVQLPREDLLELIDLVQDRLDDLALQVGEKQSVGTLP